MSNQTLGTNTGVQLSVNTDLSRIFLWENRYAQAAFNNSQYNNLLMPAGTLLGRIAATQTLALCDSKSTDGSQFPIGVLAEDTILVSGTTKTLSYCNYGDIAEDKIIFHGTDTINTVVSGRSLRDRIAADTVGIRLVAGDELTKFDN